MIWLLSDASTGSAWGTEQPKCAADRATGSALRTDQTKCAGDRDIARLIIEMGHMTRNLREMQGVTQASRRRHAGPVARIRPDIQISG